MHLSEQWHQSENGVMDGAVVQDFQKFLLDGNGNLIGVFGPGEDPYGAAIRDAIEQN